MALAAWLPPACAPICAWGSNQYGQLGNGTFTSSTTPVPLTAINNVIDMAGSQYHSLALKTDGTVWAWGNNPFGQLGNGTTSGATTATPVQVTGLTGASAIAIGYYHSLALKSDGTVWTWGYNNHGQLGNGTTANSTVPVQVASLSGVVAIASGQYHSLALKNDGTVWAWGWGQYGQLGNGAIIDSSTPVSISGLTSVTAIAAGAFHSLALKSDGTVWAWGNSTSYQLGNNSGANSAIPVQAGISNVTAIEGGALHSLALKNDGTVWAWGSNQYGEIGNGTTVALGRTPTQVIGLSNVIAIASGGQHSLALKNDTTVWAWGLNNFGQLGNGTTTNSNTPVPVSNVYGAIGLAAGTFHSMAFIDTIAPTASPTQEPVANGAGWNNSDVTVNWHWTDNVGGSGIDAANCATSTTSSGEGTLTLTATCHDGAGNTGHASYTVKVDQTDPGIVLASRSPAANAHGWNNTDVTLIWTCTDSLSGVVAAQDSQIITGEGANLSAMGTCADHADNLATHTQTGIQHRSDTAQHDDHRADRLEQRRRDDRAAAQRCLSGRQCHLLSPGRWRAADGHEPDDQRRRPAHAGILERGSGRQRRTLASGADQDRSDRAHDQSHAGSARQRQRLEQRQRDGDVHLRRQPVGDSQLHVAADGDNGRSTADRDGDRGR